MASNSMIPLTPNINIPFEKSYFRLSSENDYLSVGITFNGDGIETIEEMVIDPINSPNTENAFIQYERSLMERVRETMLLSESILRGSNSYE